MACLHMERPLDKKRIGAMIEELKRRADNAGKCEEFLEFIEPHLELPSNLWRLWEEEDSLEHMSLARLDNVRKNIELLFDNLVFVFRKADELGLLSPVEVTNLNDALPFLETEEQAVETDDCVKSHSR